MKLNYYPYTLEFHHPFRIAHGERNSTPAVFVELEENGITGFGEAALPPYLPENIKSVCAFLENSREILSETFHDLSPEDIVSIMTKINGIQPGNHAAKAALDIALHDLMGKTKNISLKQIFNNENLPPVLSTFTLGLSTRDEMRKKISEAKNFRLFKIKLNGENDKKNIELFLSEIKYHSVFEAPYRFCVDVNQGWKDKEESLEMIYWLSEKGAILIEQPLPKNMLEESAFLSEKSPVPVIADESVQGFEDLEKIKGAFTGINIKLMKCGGLIEAKKMISKARELKMKILIGCMSESSCAVTAAAHLSPLADWADLDGPCLIKNDPFEGLKIIDGKVFIEDGSGIGIKKILSS